MIGVRRRFVIAGKSIKLTESKQWRHTMGNQWPISNDEQWSLETTVSRYVSAPTADVTSQTTRNRSLPNSITIATSTDCRLNRRERRKRTTATIAIPNASCTRQKTKFITCDINFCLCLRKMCCTGLVASDRLSSDRLSTDRFLYWLHMTVWLTCCCNWPTFFADGRLKERNSIGQIKYRKLNSLGLNAIYYIKIKK